MRSFCAHQKGNFLNLSKLTLLLSWSNPGTLYGPSNTYEHFFWDTMYIVHLLLSPPDNNKSEHLELWQKVQVGIIRIYKLLMSQFQSKTIVQTVAVMTTTEHLAPLTMFKLFVSKVKLKKATSCMYHKNLPCQVQMSCAGARPGPSPSGWLHGPLHCSALRQWFGTT